MSFLQDRVDIWTILRSNKGKSNVRSAFPAGLILDALFDLQFTVYCRLGIDGVN